MRTIANLLTLGDRVFVRLASTNLSRLFLQNAEAEGFTWSDGKKPSEVDRSEDIVAIHPGFTINGVGWAGHMMFKQAGNQIIRVDYGKYLAGAEDYLIHSENGESCSSWKRLTSPDGTLIYEGFTRKGKAYGPGIAYYPDGTPIHEGIFGIKGLLVGREYYPNGQIRFEGKMKLNKAYGPSEPEYGTWYDQEGKVLFQGKFFCEHGGVGYPMVKVPENYGPAQFHTTLGDYLWTWRD